MDVHSEAQWMFEFDRPSMWEHQGRPLAGFLLSLLYFWFADINTIRWQSLHKILDSSMVFFGGPFHTSYFNPSTRRRNWALLHHMVATECRPHGGAHYSARPNVLLCLIHPHLPSESSLSHLLVSRSCRRQSGQGLVDGQLAGLTFIMISQNRSEVLQPCSLKQEMLLLRFCPRL